MNGRSSVGSPRGLPPGAAALEQELRAGTALGAGALPLCYLGRVQRLDKP